MVAQYRPETKKPVCNNSNRSVAKSGVVVSPKNTTWGVCGFLYSVKVPKEVSLKTQRLVLIVTGAHSVVF